MSDEKNPLNLEINVPRWPEHGDKLFVPGEGSASAFIGRRNFNVYAIGYKEAADALVKTVLERKGWADLKVYPIAFLYRHYLELRLKELLVSGGRVVYDESKLKHIHDLKQLWSPVKTILESVWPDSNEDEMNVLGECIDEFCSVDASSTSFRYPVTKNGDPTLPTLERVDLANLRDVMEGIASFLDASSDALGDILDNMPRLEDYY
jgi:hypothetical protein